MMGFLSFKKQRQEVEGQDTDLVQIGRAHV